MYGLMKNIQSLESLFADAESPYQSINQSMAVTDAGTKVPLYPYHTFYTLLVFKST